MANFTPRHCQKLMQQFMLYHNRCNIWATPGTGKTSASFMLLEMLRLLGSSFFPVLVLAPKTVALNVWGREQEKWDQWKDMRVVTLAGGVAATRTARLRQPADVYVLNYENVQWLTEHLKDKWPFKCVIADESTKLRNFRLRNGGKRSMALARISKHVGRWINLTGTPRPKGLIDLWGQMWFVDRGERLGRTFGEFKSRYFDEDVYAHTLTPKAHAADEIARKIADVTLTIKAEDYFDLPPIVTTHHKVQLELKNYQLYAQMQREMYVKFGSAEIEAANEAVAATKHMQIANGFLYTDGEQYVELGTEKLDFLEELVEEADGPVLVAYHWKADLARLSKRFPAARVIKTPESIDDWNAGKIGVGLIQPGSVGHGVDLAIGGNRIIFYSPWWDAELRAQVLERIGPTRQAQHGLNRPVFVDNIIAEGTRDESCMARVERRLTEQDQTMDHMKKE